LYLGILSDRELPWAILQIDFPVSLVGNAYLYTESMNPLRSS
jgi:hypothetical protein